MRWCRRHPARSRFQPLPYPCTLLKENLWCLPSRRGLPQRLLSRHCRFRPVCASSPVVVSAQRWSSVRWEEPSDPALEVGCWRGGARVGKKCFSLGRSYLRPLSSLFLTIPSHLTTSSVVLAARRVLSSLQLGDVDLAHLTLVRSVVRRLTLPCLCQAGSNTSGRPRRRACYPRARGRGNQVNIHHIIPPPGEDLLEVPD
ncbi:hypothetical protein BHE74_00033184 [Ensete ventricosum]|nr:hypothetical protein BHE74_00033184 [Ensete ventricosum]